MNATIYLFVIPRPPTHIRDMETTSFSSVINREQWNSDTKVNKIQGEITFGCWSFVIDYRQEKKLILLQEEDQRSL